MIYILGLEYIMSLAGLLEYHAEIRVRDTFGFQFSGFSVSIIRNYFLRATLQLCVNRGP